MATACYWSNLLPFKRFLSQPRQWGWFGMLVVACCLLRLPFSGFAPVPGALPFHPAAVFWPSAVMAFGPAAVLAWCAGEFLCDFWNGFPLWLCTGRLVGHVLAALWILQMRPGRTWYHNVLPFTVAWTIVCAWHAAALEWAGWYPFTYIFPLAWLCSMSACLLLTGLVSGTGAAKRLEAYRHHWAQPHLVSTKTWISPVVALSLLAACLLIIAHFSGQWYGQHLLQQAPIGSPTGWKIAVPIVPLLVISCLVIVPRWYPARSRKN